MAWFAIQPDEAERFVLVPWEILIYAWNPLALVEPGQPKFTFFETAKHS